MRLEIYATFRLGKETVKGLVHKINSKTVMVQTPKGDVIKRHIDKHHVRYLPM